MASQSETWANIVGYVCKNDFNDKLTYRCSDCNGDFISASEFEEHVTVHKTKQLKDLPKELYDEIFKFLPLDDLANMSLTCKSYKLLAESYFDRNHQNEVLMIRSNGIAKFFNHCERYKIRFRYFIRSIDVELEEAVSTTNTFLFIKRNCASHLRSLLLWSYSNNIQVNDTHFEIILEQLEHLEILLAHDVCVGFLMNHCKNIHTLSIENVGLDSGRNDWFTQSNPKLKTLILNYSLKMMDHQVFLQKNPQLKAFVIKNNELAIKGLCSTETDLEYVAFELYSENAILNNLVELKKCCNRKSIKSLDLLMANKEVDEPFGLASLRAAFDLKHAVSLHFIVTHQNLSIFRAIGIRSHIKRLCITFEIELTENVFEQMIKFPNLHCLWVYIEGVSSEISFKEMMMPIISHIRKLEKVYFRSNKRTLISESDVIELNCARSKLKNASKVIIYTDEYISSKHNLVDVHHCQRQDMLCFLCEDSFIEFKLINQLLVNSSQN